MKFILVTSLFLCLAVIGYVQGLDCYNCAYYKGSGVPSDYPKSEKSCEKKPDKNSFVTCRELGGAQNGTVKEDIVWKESCFKGVVDTDALEGVLRGCALIDSKDDGKCVTADKDYGFGPISGRICYCSEDKCNGAGYSTVSLILLSLSIVIVACLR